MQKYGALNSRNIFCLFFLAILISACDEPAIPNKSASFVFSDEWPDTNKNASSSFFDQAITNRNANYSPSDERAITNKNAANPF